MRKPLLLVCLLLLASTSIQAQYIQNLNVINRNDAAGNPKVLIQFDLVAPADNIPFKVSVVSRTKFGEKELKKVSGKVGEKIYPGRGHEIIWDYEDELVHFDGNVDLSVIATPQLSAQNKPKRGKALHLSTIGIPATKTRVDIYKNNVFVKSIGEYTPGPQTLITIPMDVQIGKGYQVAFGEKTDRIFSDVFMVKRKIGIGWYVGAGAAVAAVVALTATKPEEEKPLPGAPSVQD